MSVNMDRPHVSSAEEEEMDQEAGYDRKCKSLGARDQNTDTTRLKCANVRCGLVSPGRVAQDAAQRAVSSHKLVKAVVFCLIFMAVEVAGGISFANSLAILTDAAYLLSDIAGFAISLLAIWVAGWEATTNQSFGFYWLEILSLLVPIQLVWLLTGILINKAIHWN